MFTTPRSLRFVPLTAALLLAALAGCTPGPAYVRPSVQVPDAYKEGGTPANWQQAKPGDTVTRGHWWQVFHDDELDRLEARVSVSNQTIQKAVANLKQAKAMVGTAHAAYFPTITAGASQIRNRTSADVVGRSLAGKTVSDYTAGLDASWEPDLFDRIGHQVDAATAREQASVGDLDAVALSRHADLAMDYFNVRQFDAEARLVSDTVAAYSQAETMVRLRYQAGVSSAMDLAEAKTQRESTEAQLIDLGQARAFNEHAIAMLIGVPASNFSLPAVNATPTAPLIPAEVPSTLLQRRPDIAAAERRVAAANADVGEATSAFFPQLMLSASGGIESSQLAQFSAMPSRFWAIGPALVETLFDGGRRRHELEAARAAQAGTIADYRQTVLSAFQEVEDNLASLKLLRQESAVQERAVADSARALKLATLSYKGGATDYLSVVTVQSTYLTQERTLTNLLRRQIDADILLVKGLGGIWNETASG